MSQFILIEREIRSPNPEAIAICPIDAANDYLQSVAADNFADWRQCRLVTDLTGRGESLIDDVWRAQQDGVPIEETTFVSFLRGLFDSGVGFVIWQGGDAADLPTVHSWSETLEQLRTQTRLQPADVCLRFVPPRTRADGICPEAAQPKRSD